MCLAVPVKVVELDGLNAQIEVGGLTRHASIMLVPDVRVGDYVLLHAGYAIQKLDEKEAEETIRIFNELAEVWEGYSQSTDGETV